MSEFSDKICGKLNALTKEVSSISSKLDDLEAKVEFNACQIKDIEKKELPKLKSNIELSVSKLEEKLLSMEIYNRKPNLLFYGIAESKGEDVFSVLRAALVTLGVSEQYASKIGFVNAHRLPRRNSDGNSGSATPSTAPLPIIAKFVTMMDRDHVMSAFDQQQRERGRNKAQGSGQPEAPSLRLTVRSDLPPALKARRGALATKAYHLRKERGVSTRIQLRGVQVVMQWREKGNTRWIDYKE